MLYDTLPNKQYYSRPRADTSAANFLKLVRALPHLEQLSVHGQVQCANVAYVLGSLLPPPQSSVDPHPELTKLKAGVFLSLKLVHLRDFQYPGEVEFFSLVTNLILALPTLDVLGLPTSLHQDPNLAAWIKQHRPRLRTM